MKRRRLSQRPTKSCAERPVFPRVVGELWAADSSKMSKGPSIGRHLVGVWIGGVWNGHFPEPEKYFSEAEISRKMPEIPQKERFLPNFRLRNLKIQSPKKCNSIDSQHVTTQAVCPYHWTEDAKLIIATGVRTTPTIEILGPAFGRTDFLRIFIFEPPDFFVDFLAGFFLLIFVGKSAQKNPPGKTPGKSSKIYTTKILQHISADCPGQEIYPPDKNPPLETPGEKHFTPHFCMVVVLRFCLKVPDSV